MACRNSYRFQAALLFLLIGWIVSIAFGLKRKTANQRFISSAVFFMLMEHMYISFMAFTMFDCRTEAVRACICSRSLGRHCTLCVPQDDIKYLDEDTTFLCDDQKVLHARDSAMASMRANDV